MPRPMLPSDTGVRCRRPMQFKKRTGLPAVGECIECAAMKHFAIPLAALAALALPFSPIAHAQALTPAEISAIDLAVRTTLTETKVPSAEIAVVRDGKIVMDRAWGTASSRIAVARPDLPYQIASNSKQFVAALILLLEDEHKLSLNDKVAKWVPGVTGGDTITIRQLLSHTSGLQDFWPQDYMFTDMTHPVQPREIVDRWAGKPLDYAPGSRWQYSNTGFVVAGLIAEKAGGAPLWQQFEAKLFGPLGIHPLPLDDTNDPARYPEGYHRNALGPVRAATPPAKGWLWAAGELSMTAAELARWDIARIERTLLPDSDWALQETPVLLSDGTTNGYGLGVFNTMRGGRRVIDHGGESVGFLSQNTVFPDNRAAIVVLTNADFSGATDTLTEKIAAIVLPKAGQAQIAELDRLADARATLAMLTAGRFDPARFTANAQYYFAPGTRADYAASLRPLGAPSAFTAPRPPRLRGGFVNRNFKITYGKTKLTLITYAEPGSHGRWEQFMVTPE